MSAKAKSSTSSVEKPLNLEKKETSLWLVNVPTFVAEEWADAENGQLLGSLNITSAPNPSGGPPVRKINVTLDGDGSGPAEFTLEELPASVQQQLLAFKHSSNDESFSVEGKVTKNLTLKPRGTVQYRQKIRERSIQATTRRETRKVGHEEIQNNMSASHVIDFVPLARTELKRRQQEQQASNKSAKTTAVAVDSSELRSKLFEAFALQERRTLRDLLGFCKDVQGVRESDLRDVLNYYATYHLKGPYKKCWELKLEYKNHSVQPQGP
jgi:hypothetical protein